MTKKTEAKINQGFVLRPVSRECGNCKNYNSTFFWDTKGRCTEKRMRCEIGGFSVKKTNSCNLFESEKQ